jgi:hypothetical protein
MPLRIRTPFCGGFDDTFRVCTVISSVVRIERLVHHLGDNR